MITVPGSNQFYNLWSDPLVPGFYVGLYNPPRIWQMDNNGTLLREITFPSFVDLSVDIVIRVKLSDDRNSMFALVSNGVGTW